MQTCLEILEKIGERQRFERCFAVLERLTALRRAEWGRIQYFLQEMEVFEIHLSRARVVTLPTRMGLDRLPGTMDEIHQEMREAFKDSMDPLWIDRYVDIRLNPIRKQHAVCKETRAALVARRAE